MVYINSTQGGILQIGCDGEIDEKITGEAHPSEFVDHFVPEETSFIPSVSNDDRPAPKFI